MFDQIFTDWRSLIEGIRVWLSGGDPYGPYKHPFGYMVEAGWYAYPPPSLIIGAPLALLPNILSGLLVVAATIISFELWVRRSSGRMGLPWLILWLPFVQGIWIGQTTLLALLLLVWAEMAYKDGEDRKAGILLAFALLKPQVGILAAGWLLFEALRSRRWTLLIACIGSSVALYGVTALIAGPQIFAQWLTGLEAYRQALPDRPLLFPPLGPIVGALAGLLWLRHGRGDIFGLALLLNTLVYPLSVVYIAIGVAFVVIRWRPTWTWYPLLLSWLLPALLPRSIPRTADTIAALTQAIIASGLLAGLLPRLPLPRLPQLQGGSPKTHQ